MCTDMLRHVRARRWKRIDMVRRLCTAAAADGIDSELTRRFVRNLKSSQEEQLQQFKLASADIWEKQVRAVQHELVSVCRQATADAAVCAAQTGRGGHALRPCGTSELQKCFCPAAP